MPGRPGIPAVHYTCCEVYYLSSWLRLADMRSLAPLITLARYPEGPLHAICTDAALLHVVDEYGTYRSTSPGMH